MTVIQKIEGSRRSMTGFPLTSLEAVTVARLAEVAERICSKLESPTASVTVIDQTDLREALDALKE